MMKWVVLVLTLVGSANAVAADACEATCADTIKQCKEVCKKALKKDSPDKVGFCQDKCKEFESECKKDCDAQGSKGR
jgi:hypothetical protein